MPLIVKSKMMKQELTVQQQRWSNRFNRIAYGLFIILAMYMLITGDLEMAVVNFGIALVFDPFNAAMPWKQRPVYQKVWLMAHVVISFSGLIYLLIK